MSKRSQASRLADAIRTNSAVRTATPSADQRATSEEIIRTTFSAPLPVLIELRQLALLSRSSMNDLILLAVADLFQSLDCACDVPVRASLRERLQSRRNAKGTDIDQTQHEPGVDARQSAQAARADVSN